MRFVRCLPALILAATLPVAAQHPARTSLQVQRDDLEMAIVKDDRKKAAALIRAIEVDFNFNEHNPRGRTHESPLTMAVHRERTEIVRMLLARGADVNRRDGSGRSAVQGARTPEMAQLLVAAGAKVDAPVVADLNQELWRAVDMNDLGRTRLLLQRGANPDYDTGRERVLMRALFRKYWEVAEALVDAGASLAIPDRAGCERQRYCESIQAALFATFNPTLLARLKSRGLDLDAVGANGHTALTTLVVDQPMAIRAVGGGIQAAVAQNPLTGQAVVTQAPPSRPGKVIEIPAPDNTARLKALLDAGADPNRRYRQLTPLMLVLGTHNRPPAMADALIAAGGRIEHDATVPPFKGRGDPRAIPLDVAVLTVDADSPIAGGDAQGTLSEMRVGPLAWTVMIGRADIAARLLERDRRIEAADRNLAYFAAAGGHWDLLLAALRRKAEVNVANRAGVTPLMLAAHAGRVDVVRALIAAGADVRARSDRTWPPFLERRFGDEIGAAIAGHSPPMPKLVGGYTAMKAAEERGHQDVVRVLREAGAS